MERKAYDITYLFICVYVPSFQHLNLLTDFLRILYESYATGGHSNPIYF
jgi:hypothetical protein